MSCRCLWSPCPASIRPWDTTSTRAPAAGTPRAGTLPSTSISTPAGPRFSWATLPGAGRPPGAGRGCCKATCAQRCTAPRRSPGVCRRPIAFSAAGSCATRRRSRASSSAGHEPALLFDDAGRHRHLEPTGPILGLQALGTQAFRERRLPPVKDGLLVIVTDGITEARRANGRSLELFGSTGVVRAVQRAERGGRDTATAIHQAAEDHAHGVLVDDACVAVSAVTAGVTVPASAVMRSTPEPYLSLRPERGSSNRRRWLLPVARGRAS